MARVQACTSSYYCHVWNTHHKKWYGRVVVEEKHRFSGLTCPLRKCSSTSDVFSDPKRDSQQKYGIGDCELQHIPANMIRWNICAPAYIVASRTISWSAMSLYKLGLSVHRAQLSPIQKNMNLNDLTGFGFQNLKRIGVQFLVLGIGFKDMHLKHGLPKKSFQGGTKLGITNEFSWTR